MSVVPDAAHLAPASPQEPAHLIGQLVLTGLLSIIGMLQIFNEPLIFRGASPETVTKDFTPIMSIYFQAFTNNNYSYAAALSVVLALVIGLLSAIFYRLGNRSGV